MLDETHDAARRSFVATANGHADFPIQNLPFGIFAPPGETKRAGVAIGDSILEIASAPLTGVAAEAVATMADGTLNGFFAMGAAPRQALRAQLSALLAEGSLAALVLHDAKDCTLHLPARIGDYTDFYAGIQHATNVGALFRPDQPLMPNYKHVPIGYHGRASSIVPSGTALRRPNGQRKPAAETTPSFGPSRNLDYELELGIWIGPGNALGEPISIVQAAGHIAGFCLLNDWSARDIQGWEYQPLGPFLAKNFGSTISPWVVTPEALAPFRVPQPARDPKPMAYLWDEADQAAGALALELEVWLTVPGEAPYRLSTSDARGLYWTPAQMVAHHSCGGCNLQPGDLFGTGTISTETGYGSLLEITQGGRKPLTLLSGTTRRFLEDGDSITLRARARRDGFASIGFGDCTGTILAAP